MHRLKWYLRSRRARKIRDMIIDLEIESITITRYDLDIVFSDSLHLHWCLGEFVEGSDIKKFLHEVFGNYTAGVLYEDPD